MTRTVVSLDPDDKAWLDRQARDRHVTMTEVVRIAVRRLRAAVESGEVSFDQLLDRTAGTWPRGDGLAYQRRLRTEWDSRR
jgi:hypothetical protein